MRVRLVPEDDMLPIKGIRQSRILLYMLQQAVQVIGLPGEKDSSATFDPAGIKGEPGICVQVHIMGERIQGDGSRKNIFQLERQERIAARLCISHGAKASQKA